MKGKDIIVTRGIHHREDGLVFDKIGRYYPHPPDWDLWVNPTLPNSYAIAKGDVLRIVMQYFSTADGRRLGSNVFHYLITTLGGSATFARTASRLFTFILGLLASKTIKVNELWNNTVKVGDLQATRLQALSDTARNVNTVTGANSGGTVNLPYRSSMVARWNTAAAGKSGTGNTSFFSPDVDVAAGGVIADNNIGYLQNFCNSALAGKSGTDATDDAWSLVIFSPKQSTYDKPNRKWTTVVANPVISSSVNAVMGSQRRRQDVVG